jgi:membrane fusion protein (multidrug efflux system)
MKNNSYFLLLVIVSIIAVSVTYGFLRLGDMYQKPLQTETVAVKQVSSSIAATGVIRSQNEATLNFQVGGKLVYLPVKEGDKVTQGQTIAALDERTIQKNIQSAVDSYQNQKISFDTVNDFNGDRSLSDTGLSIAARRQLEAAVNTLDQTQLALQIQQIAQEQSILTSPINGIVMHEDVTVPYVNVTPATTFVLADPTTPVFRADVAESDIDYVSLGAPVQIQLNGLPGKTLQGIVSKIYPQKVTDANGQAVYQVDVTSDSLLTVGKLQQSGSVLITNASNSSSGTILVPLWTVLQHKYIWVVSNNQPVLRTVMVGKVHGNTIEILQGLSPNDQVITNPQSVAAKGYTLL